VFQEHSRLWRKALSWDLDLRVWVSGFGVRDLGFWGLGIEGFRIRGSGIRVEDVGFRDFKVMILGLWG
jgi:hypothetical protein